MSFFFYVHHNMSSSPVPLKTSLYLYTKGAKQTWLTGKVANKSIQLSTSKTNAIRWVVERVGNYYTIRIMNTKNYLASGAPNGASSDCTAVLTTAPKGSVHHWNIISTSTGVKISTAQPCNERGSKKIQYLKVVPSSTGGHLELASKDLDVFFALPANASSSPGAATAPGRAPFTPAPTSFVQLKLQTASQIPKVVTIEPYLRPGYFLSPGRLPGSGADGGGLQISTSRGFWYTDATNTSTSISMRFGQTSGPPIGVTSTCITPILTMRSGAINKWVVGAAAGQNGFVIRTSSKCADGKYRYIVLHTNGKVGVNSGAPTTKTVQQYLWKFSAAASTLTQIPVQTSQPTPVPTPTFVPETQTQVTLPPLTPSPTFEPTVGPIIVPTQSPTPFPSPFPSPSPFPTPTPTATSMPFPPTDSPSEEPTESPTLPPTLRPTLPPLESPTGSPTPYGGSGPININIDAGKPDRVVFPYPVAPDLLLATNPDGTLDATGGLMTDTPTGTPNETTGPGSAQPDADLLIPQIDEEDQLNEDESEDVEGFWTTTRIIIAVIALVLVGTLGYYIYTKYSGSSNTGSNNSGNKVNNRLNSSLDAPLDSTFNTPLNTGGLNTTGPNTVGANAGPDTFGDGFDDFANVENIGPPPPTSTTR